MAQHKRRKVFQQLLGSQYPSTMRMMRMMRKEKEGAYERSEQLKDHHRHHLLLPSRENDDKR